MRKKTSLSITPSSHRFLCMASNTPSATLERSVNIVLSVMRDLELTDAQLRKISSYMAEHDSDIERMITDPTADLDIRTYLASCKPYELQAAQLYCNMYKGYGTRV